MAPALKLERLTRFYGDRVALHDVSVEVAVGRTLAVFGSNGAGKTTLLRILATLLRPHHGTATVLGSEVPRHGHAVRGRIGFLGHEPLLYRELTARENLRFHARLHGVAQQRVEEVLDGVGLPRRADEPVRFLSRGMVQRVAIARAALHGPEMLLLDEPFAGLDPAARQAIEPLIGRSTQATRVIISHDLEQGLEDADEVLGLKEGKVELLKQASDTTVGELRALYAP